MARQIRIECPGAFYHVYSRGNQKQPIALSDEDRCYFIGRLREAHERFGVVIHVYALMPNHFHLLLETPQGNLSRLMHFLITSYTVYFNKKHKKQGHLFQGRFKSILVEAAAYAQELSRYLHLNPVRAHIVEAPEDYPWSSYGYYIGRAVPERWLDIRAILRLFGDDLAQARLAYVDYIREKIGPDEFRALKESLKKGILGSDEFVALIKREWLGKDPGPPDREKPQLRKLRDKPDLSRILDVSRTVLGPGGKWTTPMAVFISHSCTCLTLNEIGRYFSLSVSGVSNACIRVRRAINGDPALGRAVEEINRETGLTFLGKR